MNIRVEDLEFEPEWGWDEDMDCEEDPELEDAQKGIWTTQHGKRIRVSKMDDKHLCNTFRFVCIRACMSEMLRDEWKYVLETEIVRRGLEVPEVG